MTTTRTSKIETHGKYYNDGFRDGATDHHLGYTSIISRTYPEHCLPGYAQGYIDGYNATQQESFLYILSLEV